MDECWWVVSYGDGRVGDIGVCEAEVIGDFEADLVDACVGVAVSRCDSFCGGAISEGPLGKDDDAVWVEACGAGELDCFLGISIVGSVCVCGRGDIIVTVAVADGRGRLYWLDWLCWFILWECDLEERDLERPGVGVILDRLCDDGDEFTWLRDESFYSGVRKCFGCACERGVRVPAEEIPERVLDICLCRTVVVVQDVVDLAPVSVV